jgi:hypothetical protein
VGGTRLGETEERRVQIEDARARAQNGDEKGTDSVKDYRIAHEGEREDGLEDAGRENIQTLAHD